MDEGQLVRWLLDVAGRYHWHGRRGLTRVQPDLEARALIGSYELALSDPDTQVHVEYVDDAPAAAVTVKRKPMESASFGVATAAVSNVVAAEDLVDRVAVIRRLLTRVHRDASRAGIELLVLRVDSEDVQTLCAAQESGFGVFEATMTWLAETPVDAAPMTLAPGLSVHVYEGDVSEALTTREIDQLAAATTSWELNHFRADPHLPRAAVDRFYSQWVHNIASGDWCDCLFVARHEGRLVGIESEYSDRDLLALAGVDVRACEWLVVLDRGLGAGRALMDAAGHHRFPGGSFHTWETQVRNLPTVRCIEQTGVARPIRSSYTLHGWPRHG